MHLGQHSGDGVADVADPIRGAGVYHGERDRDREIERGEWIEMGQYRGERGRTLKRPRKEDVETERSREVGLLRAQTRSVLVWGNSLGEPGLILWKETGRQNCRKRERELRRNDTEKQESWITPRRKTCRKI